MLSDLFILESMLRNKARQVVNSLVDVVPAPTFDQIVGLTTSALLCVLCLSNINLGGKRGMFPRVDDLGDLLVM